MSICVYTAIAGGYDSLKEHPEIPGVDFVCFTDDEDLSGCGWQTSPLAATGFPRLDAKRPKILGPQEELADYDYTIWIDGSHEILTSAFVEEALSDLGPDGFALHRHPSRDCIYDEVPASRCVAHKYDGMPLEAQAEHYRSEGHPAHFGLWACGSMARARSHRLDAAMADWWAEIEKWSIQDQISLPPVVRRHRLSPRCWPYPQLTSPWLRIHYHTEST